MLYYYSNIGGLIQSVDLCQTLLPDIVGPNNIIQGETIDDKAWGDLTSENQSRQVYYVKQVEPIDKTYRIYKDGRMLVDTGIRVDEGFVGSISKLCNTIFVAGFVYPFGKRKRINNYLQIFSKKGRFRDQFEYEITNEDDGNNDPILLKSFARKMTEFCISVRKGDYIDIFAVVRNKIKPIHIAMPTVTSGEEFSPHRDILVYDRDKEGVQIIILKNKCLGSLKIKF